MDALLESFPGHGWLMPYRDLSLETLAKLPEVPETVLFDEKADSSAGWRWALTIATLVLLVVIGYLVHRRPSRRVP